MKHHFIYNFILCGFIGWCLECLWTGLGAIIAHNNPKLNCTTSVWMFPIYGMAAAIGPIYRIIHNLSTITRGVIYAFGILSVEFVSGSLLKRINACPWDYSNARFQYKGVIRFDYLPLWFIVGLLYERFLTK